MGQRQRNILKGALAGLVAGFAGSAAKTATEKIFSPTGVQAKGPQPIFSRDGGDGNSILALSKKPLAQNGNHWVIGGLIGAAYGAFVELQPKGKALRGVAFGLTLNRLAHQGKLPIVGRVLPVKGQPETEKKSTKAGHVAYGVVTELVRAGVRAII